MQSPGLSGRTVVLPWGYERDHPSPDAIRVSSHLLSLHSWPEASPTTESTHTRDTSSVTGPDESRQSAQDSRNNALS